VKFTTIKVPVGSKPDALAHKIEKLGGLMDIKIIASMVWHPHGVVVIIGHEDKAPPKKAAKPRRPRVLPTESALQKPSE
jgi:hypothetical protein